MDAEMSRIVDVEMCRCGCVEILDTRPRDSQLSVYYFTTCNCYKVMSLLELKS